jgi:hypothetical protein
MIYKKGCFQIFIKLLISTVVPLCLLNYFYYEKTPLEIILESPILSGLFLLIIFGISYFVALYDK